MSKCERTQRRCVYKEWRQIKLKADGRADFKGLPPMKMLCCQLYTAVLTVVTGPCAAGANWWWWHTTTYTAIQPAAEHLGVSNWHAINSSPKNAARTGSVASALVTADGSHYGDVGLESYSCPVLACVILCCHHPQAGQPRFVF
jgi:hypothetical protein